MPGIPFIVGAFFVFAVYLFSCIYILKEYERGVIFRLGRVLGRAKGPGLFFVFRPFDTIQKVSLRTLVHDVPSQDIITRDNVSVKVNAVVYFRVVDPVKAVVEVENFLYATSQLAQTTLRSVLGQARARRAPGRARQAQRPAPGDRRRADRSLGHQGFGGRGQARRPAAARCSAPWPVRPRPSARSAPRSFTPKVSTRLRLSSPRRRP